jgi:hypothetical protein
MKHFIIIVLLIWAAIAPAEEPYRSGALMGVKPQRAGDLPADTYVWPKDKVKETWAALALENRALRAEIQRLKAGRVIRRTTKLSERPVFSSLTEAQREAQGELIIEREVLEP